jgi:Reverse transcriptase (RNA-dependent DNA polymerase)
MKNLSIERKLIGNCWVFVKKRDRTFTARLVALGYLQVAGIDFNNHFPPVLDDTSRVFLMIIQNLKLEAWSLDVETTFLNGNLSEEILWRFPKDTKKCLANLQRVCIEAP